MARLGLVQSAANLEDSMLTDEEKQIVQKWNEFAARPRNDIRQFRLDLDSFVDEIGMTSNLPEVGALHEGVEIRPGLKADVSVPMRTGPHPVVVYLHGGGWVAGNLKTHRKIAMCFAQQGYLTINVDYRLAPENPFPAGLDDCVAAIKWAALNCELWNGDLSRIAVAGDSAGANLAAASMMTLSKESDAPKCRAGVLIYGVFDFSSIIERSPARAPVEAMAKRYLGSHFPEALNDPRVSPRRGIKPGILPPCFVICGTADQLLLESRSMAAAMKESSIPCELHEIPDMPHAFMQLHGLSGCREGHRLMFDFLKRNL
jgi:acetyl esterase